MAFEHPPMSDKTEPGSDDPDAAGYRDRGVVFLGRTMPGTEKKTWRLKI